MSTEDKRGNKMKEKLKSKRFWITLVGAVIVLLQAIGLKVDVPAINEIVTAVCSVAIVLGVMIEDTKTKNSEQNESENNEETE